MTICPVKCASFFLLAHALSWLAWLRSALRLENALGQLALFAAGFAQAVATTIIT
jgi:hypothetical protein